MRHERFKNIFNFADARFVRGLKITDKQTGMRLTPFVAYPDSVARLLAFMMDEEVTKYYWNRAPRNASEVMKNILSKYNDRSIAGFDLVHPQHGFIGHADLSVKGTVTKVAEASLLIGEKSVWGQGIGLRAMTMLCALANHAGIKYMYTKTHDKNTRFLSLMEHFPHDAPYTFEGVTELRIPLHDVDFSSIDPEIVSISG
jgi:RimJ/RimL family protein N-acetyltransferase